MFCRIILNTVAGEVIVLVLYAFTGTLHWFLIKTAKVSTKPLLGLLNSY